MTTTTIKADFEAFGHQWGPVWKPLEATVNNPGDYMWISYAILADGARVEAYKHAYTRRYLYLDDRGRAWRFANPGMVQVSIEDAVAHAES